MMMVGMYVWVAIWRYFGRRMGLKYPYNSYRFDGARIGSRQRPVNANNPSNHDLKAGGSPVFCIFPPALMG